MNTSEGGTSAAVFITGATGFIGRRVMAALGNTPGRSIRCLVRDGRSVAEGPWVTTVRGDLDRPETFAAALAGTRTVLHLAARTGKGSRRDHFSANCEGTEKLVRASREAGVTRFINVSSIAATYAHRTAYHYADAKRQAEQIVRSSGLRFVNVRPTFVLGAGSPVGSGLVKLATLPLVPLFGDGAVRVQPIHVDDVAGYLAAALGDEGLDNHDVDLGGPEIVSMKDLLMRIRRAAKGSEAVFVRLPGFATMRALAIVEPLVGNLLPIGAGQLSAFVNDSTVKATVPGRPLPRLRYTLDETIRDMVTRA
jgi:uncharacterized protein YbjT (DUF2867 family)